MTKDGTAQNEAVEASVDAGVARDIARVADAALDMVGLLMGGMPQNVCEITAKAAQRTADRVIMESRTPTHVLRKALEAQMVVARLARALELTMEPAAPMNGGARC